MVACCLQQGFSNVIPTLDHPQSQALKHTVKKLERSVMLSPATSCLGFIQAACNSDPGDFRTPYGHALHTPRVGERCLTPQVYAL